ncbi:uncharacterized protein LOC144170483 isoform X2 [Haemaphysalis longicornis]
MHGSSRPEDPPGETWVATAQDDSLPREPVSEPSPVAAATASAAGSSSNSGAAAPATNAAGQPNDHVALLELVLRADDNTRVELQQEEHNLHLLPIKRCT